MKDKFGIFNSPIKVSNDETNTTNVDLIDIAKEELRKRDIAENTEKGKVAIYFAVSPLKLVVMSVCTMGIYELYWFYKNWVLIKDREKIDIMPFWRSFFAYFFCYSFFKKVQASAVAVSLDKPITPGLLATGWIIITVLWKLPDPFWLITYFAVIFLLPIQAMVNDINKIVAPTHDRNRRFTGWNIFGVIVGGLFFILVLYGTFFPDTIN